MGPVPPASRWFPDPYITLWVHVLTASRHLHRDCASRAPILLEFDVIGALWNVL